MAHESQESDWFTALLSSLNMGDRTTSVWQFEIYISIEPPLLVVCGVLNLFYLVCLHLSLFYRLAPSLFRQSKKLGTQMTK